jgi:hypothetical protein
MRFTVLIAMLVCSFAITAAAQSGWQAIRDDNGDIKATIEVSTIIRDQDGNAHARVCLIEDGKCTNPLRWFFNCNNHQYSAIDTSIFPQLPHEMNDAEPGSIADQLAAVACK